MTKDCLDTHIINPKTKRCVSRKGKIGRQIINKSNDCHENQVKNPLTNRCVSRNGKLGKKLILGKNTPKKISPKKVFPKRVSPPIIVNPVKSYSRTYTFLEGLNMLSLIRCIQKKDAPLGDTYFWARCFSKSLRPKKITDKYGVSKSFIEPYYKFSYADQPQVFDTIKKSFENFNNIDLTEIDTFHKKGSIDINKIYSFFDLFEDAAVQRITEISLKEIDKLSNIPQLKKLWNKTYPNEDLLKFSKDVKRGYKFQLILGNNGCVRKLYNDTDKFDDIKEGMEIIKNLPARMEEDFYVFRSVIPSQSYEPKDKINTLLDGLKLIEPYPTFISTSWKLDTALNWTKDFCCFYVIKVPKDSDYFIFYDSFKNDFDKFSIKSEHEITLNPGILTVTDIKFCQYKNTSKIIFFAEYTSFKNLEIDKHLC